MDVFSRLKLASQILWYQDWAEHGIPLIKKIADRYGIPVTTLPATPDGVIALVGRRELLAPRADAAEIVAAFEAWAALREMESEDDEPDDLLDEVCGVLTPTQQRIVRYLWKLKHRISKERLAENCGMSPEPEAMKQAFKRLSNRLLEKGFNAVYLDTDSAGRVKLVHP